MQSWNLLGWCAGILILLMLLLWHKGPLDHDMFHEMALAREIFRLGRVPTEDFFAYTRTAEMVVHHEWGSGIVFYAVATLSGIHGILALKCSVIILLAALVYRCAKIKGAGWHIILITAAIPISLSIGALRTAVRAQHFTLVFLAVLLLLLELDRKGKRWWIGLWLPLHVLWLNLHAGFVVGLGVLFLHGAERSFRRKRVDWPILATLCAAGILTLVNPYGWDYLPYLWRGITMSRPLIAEWRPVWQEFAWPYVLVYGLTLFPIFYVAYRRNWGVMKGLPLLLVCAYLAARHARHLSLYAVVWAAYMPAWLQKTQLGSGLDMFWNRHVRPMTTALSAAALIAFLVLLTQGQWGIHASANLEDLERDRRVIYPAGAVRYLQDTRFTGNVMTPFNACGSYVMWHLYPDVKVSMDSRYEVAYAHGMAREVHRFFGGREGWQETLAKYPTDLVMTRVDYPVSELMADETPWELVYQDDVFRVFARPDIDLPKRDRRGEKLKVQFP